MSTSVDQRSKGQPHAASNGPGKDSVNEDFENYLLPQQPPQQTMRQQQQWSAGYNTAATAMTSPGSVTDQQAQQQQAYMGYYPSIPPYPFMNQSGAATLNDGAWSNGDPSMNFLGGGYGQMGTDYMGGGNAVFGNFGGYQPNFNWDFPGASDYSAWGAPATGGAPAPNSATTGAAPARKDDHTMVNQYPSEYYMPPHRPDNMAVGYGSAPGSVGMLNGIDGDRDMKNVEHGLKEMQLSGQSSGMIEPGIKSSVGSGAPSKELDMGISQNQTTAPASHHSPVSMGGTATSSSSVSSAGSSGPAAKKSWASIASAPAKQHLSLKPKSIPRAPVLQQGKHGSGPGVGSGLDIGTWDSAVKRESSSIGSVGKSVAGQPLPTRQTWNAASVNRSNVANQRAPTTNYSGSIVGPSSTPGASSNGSGPTHSGNVSEGQSNSSGNHVPSTMNGSNSGGNNNAASNSTIGQNVGSNDGQAYMSSMSNSHSSSSMSGGNPPMDAPQPGPAPHHPVLDRLRTANQYNPRDMSGISSKNARFFIIKSYSEDDIHRSIKYSIWCSTEHGNKRLDAAFREREGKGPIYLFFSVNGSGHFCGMTQMMSPLDYSSNSNVWAQDKWKGKFEVKWIYVKDVPNSQLRHIRLENNENKPVTNSRDTQEVPPEKGRQVLKIIDKYRHTTSIFDDFSHYEKRQEEDHHQHHNDRGHHQSDRGHHHGERGSYRGHHGMMDDRRKERQPRHQNSYKDHQQQQHN